MKLISGMDILCRHALNVHKENLSLSHRSFYMYIRADRQRNPGQRQDFLNFLSIEACLRGI